MIENKRSAQRLFRKPSDMWQIAINNDELITRNVVNISPTGLAFKAPAKAQFKKGQTVNVQFNLTPERQFDVQGEVMWNHDNQFGLKFSKIPMTFDSYIMAAIHELTLSEEGGSKLTSAFRKSQKALEQNQFFSSAMALFFVAVMTAAFALSVFIQQQHPESKLSSQYEKSFSNYLKHGPGK